MPRRPRRMIRTGLCGVSSCLGTFALLLAFVATAGCAGDRPPRNLILISIDTLRPDFLSCYGYEQESSPAIDRLAASGTLFEDVTSASPWTLPAQAPLEIFNAGRDVTDTAIEWLRSRDANKQLFLFLHYYDTHSDFTPDPNYRKSMVAPYRGPLDGSTAQLLEVRHGRLILDEEDRRWLRQMYAAEIRTLDGHLGRLFAYLEESGLADDTLVLLTSDHGEQFGEHGEILHGDAHHQEQLAIPLIMRGPGVHRGCRSGEAAHLVDVAPTALSLLRVTRPVEMDGRDLTASWCGREQDPAPRPLFASADKSWREGMRFIDVKKMVRLGPWELLVDRRDESHALYDLESDPGELRNRASDQHERVVSLSDLHERDTGEAAPIGQPDEELRKRLEALGYMERGE